MKRLLNVAAFLVVVWFVSAWDCGDIEFRTLLVNILNVLFVLAFSHIFASVISFVLQVIVKKRKMA